MKGSLLSVWLVIATLAVGGYAAYSGWRVYQARTEESRADTQLVKSGETASRIVLDAGPRFVRPVEDYRLIEQSGANFRSDRLRGHVWAANIFFSSCTAECLRLTQQMHWMQETYPRLRLLSMTCDPDVDTPEKLRGYATANNADPNRWFFVTGKMQDLQRFSAEAWGIPLKRLEHTSRIIVVDRNGELRETGDVMTPSDVERLEERLDALFHEMALPPEPAG